MRKMNTIVVKRLPQYSIHPDFSRPHHQTSVGIELEVENIDSYSPHLTNLKRWTVDREERSILNGIELVSDPVWGSAISDALLEIKSLYRKTSPVFSSRTSTHVHLNILDMSTQELIEFLLIYLKYEKVLFNLHGSRENNIFCIPAYKSTAVQEGFLNCIIYLKRERVLSNYTAYKYSALNLNSISTYGTVEFRHMGGTADLDRVNTWINIILQIKASVQLGFTYESSPEDIFDEMLDSINLNQDNIAACNHVLDFLYIKGVL